VGHAVIMLPLVRRGDKGLERSVFAFAPTFALRGTSSTESSGAEGVARWWRRCPRSKWFRGVFDVTVDGRVLLDCGLPEASRRVYKKEGGGAAQAFLPFCTSQNPSILKPFARSHALLALVHRGSGPRQADLAPPPTVRSHVVLFIIRCEYAVGRTVVRRYFQ
jgi:hypothetical protein